ncbi:glucose import [Tritrichomonas musculus]|uniref:Glucose import n=1 Tax=Tritrichomonas musculus TaxID=1915356 RepID=A0ABR2GR84_9EUKA
MGIFRKELGYAFIIMIGSLTYGDVSVYTSPTSNDIRTKHHLSDTSAEWTFYCSIPFLFGIVGSLITKYILLGFKGRRKLTVFVVDIIGTAAWLLNCLTKVHIAAGIVSRALCGVAMGAYMTINPMYLVEIAPEGFSGVFGAINQFGVCIGNILFSILGVYLDYMELNYVGAAICALQGFLIWICPESPESKNGTVDEVPLLSVFKPQYAKGLFIGITTMFMVQFSGINGILANLNSIMDEAGLNMDPGFQSTIAVASQFVAIFVNFFTVELLGRKVVWMLSSAICGIGLLLLALNDQFEWSNTLPVISIFLFYFGFGYGIGSISWFIVSEYFETDTRAAANSVCVICNWIFAFILVMVFPSMKKSMGMFGSSIFFFVVCMLSIIFGLYAIPEPVREGESDQFSAKEEDESAEKSEKSEI